MPEYFTNGFIRWKKDYTSLVIMKDITDVESIFGNESQTVSEEEMKTYKNFYAGTSKGNEYNTIEGNKYSNNENKNKQILRNIFQKNCTNLFIGMSVENICDKLFSNFTSLKSIKFYGIEDDFTSIESIGNNAFNGCKSLEEITIPMTVTNLGQGCFDGCSQLSTITFKGKLFYNNLGISNSNNLDKIKNEIKTKLFNNKSPDNLNIILNEAVGGSLNKKKLTKKKNQHGSRLKKKYKTFKNKKNNIKRISSTNNKKYNKNKKKKVSKK